jgi:hypothetical protein
VLRPPGDSAALPVLTALGGVAGSGQVLELEAGGRRFGLLVDEVVGVLRDIHAARGPAPEGQEAELVCGTLLLEDCSVLLLDGEALARRLEPAGPRVTRRD